MVSLQTTFLKQFFDIAQGKRVAKIPADRTKNQLRFGLPPLAGRVAIGFSSSYQQLPTEVATQPSLFPFGSE
jgi:hypothetical protein